MPVGLWPACGCQKYAATRKSLIPFGPYMTGAAAAVILASP